jgi:hypothetical protein
MSSLKDYVKVYDKKSGKWKMQHYKGGVYFDNLKQIRPSHLHGNITGKGHPAPHSKKAIDEAMDIVEQNNNIGDKILASLRKNQNGMGMESHSSIENRIKKLVLGSGLQVY